MSWWNKFGNAIMGGIETALDIGASAIPGGSLLKTGIKRTLQLGKIGMGTAKDLYGGVDLSDLSSDIGDLKNGLAGAKAQIENQSKELRGEITNIKTELLTQLNQQEIKFNQEIKELDTRIATATEQLKADLEKEKKERQEEARKLQTAINQVSDELNRVENKLTEAIDDLRNEVNERFAEQEQKILNNKRKIEEEKLQREEEIRETHSKIKLTNTNLENLRKEKQQLADDFLNYKSSINQQTADTQQTVEDLEAEYQRKTKILEAKIEDNQEQLAEFNEQLTNTQREQAQSRLEREEIYEELAEQSDLLHFQKHQINLVSQQMEDISDEIHGEMSKVKKDHQKLFTLATETSQKLDNLTDQVQSISQKTVELEQQVKENKEATEKAKKEAKLANERLDNYIKAQKLLDTSAQELVFNKIQKSLELKAEETKLLATLNLLQETKKLIRVEPAERDWKVGVKKGTAPKDYPEPEGYQLVPNSSWERKYTGDLVKPDNPCQIFTQEWFNWEEENKLRPEDTKLEWGQRIKNDNEKAPLTTPEKRKEQQTEENQSKSKNSQLKVAESAETIEKLEELKAETLQRLQEIQQQIQQSIQAAENTSPKPVKPLTKTQTLQQQIQQKAQAVQNLAKKPYSVKNQKQLDQAQKDQEKAQKELAEVQAQLSDPSFQFEQELEKHEEKVKEDIATQNLQETQEQWETIQQLSQQALQDQPEKPQEKPGEKKDQDPDQPKESELEKKLAELVQQIKQMEESVAASQKQMTYAMLFLIIFLLEYVVYKRNGLPGLVILNVLLSIAYYYREDLKKYADLWGKYLLIIGYVMGNVLAYSAPEQEKYKWPAVAGFNIAILSIYAYTLYQQKQEQAKIETHYQQKSQEILTTANFTAEEQQKVTDRIITEDNAPQILGFNNPFTNSIPTSQKVEQFSQLVQEQVLEKQIAEELTQQKQLAIQQQAETLQKAHELEQQLKGNLAKVQGSLGESRMNWTKIKEIYPDFADKSILLGEFEKADKLLVKAVKSDQTLTKRLARLPVSEEKEADLLSGLNLTLEQYIAISLKTPYLTKQEEEFIIQNYPDLDLSAKLQLISSGLNALEINTFEKKEKFVELNHTLYQEKQLFGLSTKEKENILKFIHSTINLTEEQKQALEEMGIKPYNASEWTVTEEQKDHLLDFGLNKLKLSEEQQASLTNLHPDQFKTFSLTGEQKNILNSLAPLIRENKYSLESLELLKSLQLKPNTNTFLVQEEIIPDLHNSFGTVKSSYLPLKIKFLKGEQKTLRKFKEIQEKKISEEQIKENKLSILKSLLEFAENRPCLPGTVIENEDGSISKAEYLDLKDLTYSLTEWVNQGVLTNWQADILSTCGFKTVPKYNFFELLIFAVEKFTETSWAEFLRGNEELAEEFEEYTKSLENSEITINETIWEKFVSSQSSQQKETINALNLKALIEEQINQRLGNWKPSEQPIEKTEKITEDDGKPEAQPIASTSRYDNLLENLNKEDTEREKKKKEREVAKNKFEEAERTRREQKLTEKDKKLKEDEEKRQKEKELAEKEEKKRREAEEARSKALQEEQERIFNSKLKNIEDAKKRAEEALENQKKSNELAEQKKKDEIKKLEKENELEQERLTKQAQLIEEEKQKKLASIALEDQEQRQRIQREADAEKARILQEANDKKRANEAELKKKEAELLKQQQTQQVEIERLTKERELQTKMGQELARLANEQTRILRENKNHGDQMRAYRESIWNYVLDYYWASTESSAGTQNPTQYSYGTLRSWLSSYPSMKFNLVHGDKYSCNWTNNGWKLAMKAFYGVAGNTFVDQWEFKSLLEQKVLDMQFLNRIDG